MSLNIRGRRPHKLGPYKKKKCNAWKVFEELSSLKDGCLKIDATSEMAMPIEAFQQNAAILSKLKKQLFGILKDLH